MQATRYNAGARTLHWVIAVLIILNLILGLFHDALGSAFAVIPFHKSVGLTILVLSVLRLAWRMTWKAPPYPGSLPASEIAIARTVHAILYVLMIAMPLSGWIMSSAGKYPLTFFGLFDWPKFAVTRGDLLVKVGQNFHGIGGWILLVLALGHIAAALRHQLLLKDGVFQRMW